MTDGPPATAWTQAVGWELTLINPAHDNRKFYRLIVSGPILMINYGRIGHSGCSRAYRLASFNAARDKAIWITTDKERTGYRPSIAPLRFPVPAAVPEACLQLGAPARRELVDAFLDACGTTRTAHPTHETRTS
ncbi:WGR domain-containing protein [Planomonospora corallina]|uniref:WGR domain-containing protein n=1 Tax=Planomonospora corallina TaxID=1806052 RepID=A0ABV8IBM4_9ACTN